jgi:predicted Fe-Mo cluster-binding NifX family protein
MKVAVTVWQKRVSPVFDSSHMLLVVEIENAAVINREYIGFDPDTPSSLKQTMDRMDVSVLICGAVSEQLASVIEAGRMTLIPFTTGDVDEVLECYARNGGIGSAFLMPGCSRTYDRKGGQ